MRIVKTRWGDYASRRKTAGILGHGLRKRTEAAARLLNGLAFNREFHLLDIGTADGSMLERMKLLFPHGVFHGVDTNLQLVEMARARGLSVVEGDARSLQFPDHSFDVVLLTATLKHIADSQQVLGECRRVIVPGGHLILSDPTPFGVRLGVWFGHFDPKYLPNVWSLKEARHRVELEGFQVRRRSKYMLFPVHIPGADCVEALLSRMHMTPCFLQQILLAQKMA
jgi:SAM-dependent methyltransferase